MPAERPSNRPLRDLGHERAKQWVEWLASTGILSLGDRSPRRGCVRFPWDALKISSGFSAPEMDKQLTDNFQPLDNSILEQNALATSSYFSIPAWERCISLGRPPEGLNGLKQEGSTPRISMPS
jgi:hypothetical protein